MTDIRRHATLDSTSEEARRLALAGEHGPLWVIAEEQTKGRGRRGRDWISRKGNLFASHLLEVDAPAETCATLSFVAALSAADTVAALASNARVTLKWPNDVLLEGRKASGVLLEGAPNGALQRLIVGIGINLAHHPEGMETPAISLAAVTHATHSPEDALACLVAAWDRWYALWREGGFAPIRAAWLSRAGGLGETVTVRTGQSEMMGVFETLDEDGALRLHLEDGRISRVTAGEVFFSG